MHGANVHKQQPPTACLLTHPGCFASHPSIGQLGSAAPCLLATLLCSAGVALVAHRIRRPLIFDREENIAKLQVGGWADAGLVKVASGGGNPWHAITQPAWRAAAAQQHMPLQERQ